MLFFAALAALAVRSFFAVQFFEPPARYRSLKSAKDAKEDAKAFFWPSGP
jgi:hypothetical protein